MTRRFLRRAVRAHARAALVAILTLVGGLLRPAPVEAQTGVPASNRFGVVDDYQATTQAAMDRAREAGIGWVRYEFYWNFINPAPGVYDWSLPDRELAYIEAAGLNVYGTVVFPPTWATGATYPAGQEPFYCVTNPDHPDCSDPTKVPSVATFEEFVRVLVTRYKDRIRFWGFGTEVHNHNFWPGTARQFVQTILMPGYRTVKAIDPALTVVGPDEDLASSLEYLLSLEPIDGRWCDVISFHILRHSGGGLAVLDQTLEPVVQRLGDGRPVWITEVGMMVGRSALDESIQAGWLAEQLQGIIDRPWIDKAFIYRLKDAQAIDFGMLREDDSPKPSYTAVRNVIAANPATASIRMRITGNGRVTSGAGTLAGDFSAVASSLNSTVTLTPQADPGWAFAGWAGDADCLDGVVTLSDGRLCRATFLQVAGTAVSRALDFNGDGAGDVFQYDPVTGDWSQELSNRAGGFGRSTGRWDPGWATYAGDFNGDGLGDLFLWSEPRGLWFKAFSNGRGGFSYFGGTWSPNWQLTILDFNGDRLSDVFVYNRTNGIWFKCLSLPNGSFAYHGGVWSPNWTIYPVEFNGDGRSDLFLYDERTGWWFRAIDDGAGGFHYSGGQWSSGWQIHPADLDGDGRSDLFLWDPPSGVWFYALNTGAGFDYVGGLWSPNWKVHVADLDANARADFFLYIEATGQWVKLYNVANGVFAVSTGFWSPNWTIHTTDLNADRRLDVVLYNELDGTWVQCLNLTNADFVYTVGAWATGQRIVASRTAAP